MKNNRGTIDRTIRILLAVAVALLCGAVGSAAPWPSSWECLPAYWY